MVSKKLIRTIDELQCIQMLASKSQCEVGLRSLDGGISIDAKSYIGMYALNFKEPILIISDDESFHKKIKDIGENVE